LLAFLSLSIKRDYTILVQVIDYFNFEIIVFGNIKGVRESFMEKLVAIAMAMSSFVYLGDIGYETI
jgi:hypothetical protein